MSGHGLPRINNKLVSNASFLEDDEPIATKEATSDQRTL